MEKKFQPKINEYNILWINIQLLLTIATTVLFVVYLFDHSILWILELVSGVTLLILAFNNHRIFKRQDFTKTYLIVGLIVIAISLITLMGVLNG